VFEGDGAATKGGWVATQPDHSHRAPAAGGTRHAARASRLSAKPTSQSRTGPSMWTTGLIARQDCQRPVMLLDGRRSSRRKARRPPGARS